jgi:phospholipid-translocating ATPase
MKMSHAASSEGDEKKVPEGTATGLSPHQESQRLPDITKRDHASVVLPNYASWRSRSARIGVFGRVKSLLINACKTVLRISELPPSKDGRKIDLNAMRKSALIDERTGKEYIGNTIRSSRYTLWNFLPRQLFAQFSKLANLSVSIRALLYRYKLTLLQLFLSHINTANDTR